jgi:hypothetical protein
MAPIRMPNLKEWRERARAAFALMPRGARAQCARDLGISAGQLSDTIHESKDPNVEDRSSLYITQINDWLRGRGLDFPTMLSLPDNPHEVGAVLEGLTELERSVIQAMRDDADPFRPLAEHALSVTPEVRVLLSALAQHLRPKP